MNPERTQQWTRILNLTHRMLKAAHDEQWDELVEMEQNRRQMIRNFFATTASRDEVDDITEGTHQILTIDKEIMQISKKQRDEIGSKLSEIKQHSRAKKAYMQNSG